MTINTNDMLNSILESISRIDYIHPEDIPNIDLYMDQVTTFMDAQLASTKRYHEDKILTKTMINNYAKNNLLPPPVKKKYTKEHVLVLIFIYYFKNILSIKDIETLLKPITDKAFSDGETLDMTELYEAICAMERPRSTRYRKRSGRLMKKPRSHFLTRPRMTAVICICFHLSAVSALMCMSKNC